MASAKQPAFLTSHAYVVLGIVTEPGSTVRDLAQRVGITERATYSVLRDLESGGIVSRTRAGRRLSATVDLDRPLDHPLLSGVTLGDLVAVLRGRTKF